MAIENDGLRSTIWLRPFLALLAAATLLFFASFFADQWLLGRPRSFVDLLFSPHSESAANTLGNVAEVVAAVLGVAITVVAIIVELAANRYTSRITGLFFRDPVNFAVMGFFVLSCVQCMWVILEFDPLFTPRVGTAVTMVMMTLSLLVLLPYFAYVFAFLDPEAVIDRIRADANRSISGLDPSSPARRIVESQRLSTQAVDQISDISVNAIAKKDKGISTAAVDALIELLFRYLEEKRGLPEAWFRMSEEIARDPDFISMSQRVLSEIGERRVWLEMKVLREYETIYAETLNETREINYRVAINTRQLAERAIGAEDPGVVELALKFFNTYLRATINAGDVRTGYNVLNQYRLLGEAALAGGNADRVVQIAGYLEYYGRTAYGRQLPFLLEVVAYDVCNLCEKAHASKSAAHEPLLATVLELGKEPATQELGQALRGVRKAQVKLAAYYLTEGDGASARRIYEEMAGEPPARLASIRDELLAVESRDFWEIIDRGTNLDYLPPSQKAHVVDFFRWFEDRIHSRAEAASDSTGFKS